MSSERPRRVASHDDDPSASMADRLLLALGIWPHHAEQAGFDETLDAVVMLRWDAHRFPMCAEDFGRVNDELSDLKEAVENLLVARRQSPGTQREQDAWDDLARLAEDPDE